MIPMVAPRPRVREIVHMSSSVATRCSTLLLLAACGAAPALGQPVGQGHGVQLPRPPHHHVVTRDGARVRFMREHPCPAIGRFTTNCPGWRVEYIVPPERGGADRADNLKWERTDVTRPAD
jgi:hypothetical protein